MTEVLLSEAARVKINPDLLISQPLSSKRKKELRIALVKQYINSRPYGTRIKVSEFTKLLHLGSDANAYAFIEKLIRDKVVVKHSLSLRRFFYTVPGDVKVTKPADKPEKVNAQVDTRVPVEELMAAAAQEHDRDSGALPGTRATKQELTDLDEKAMRYLWHYPGGDVRGFVKWMKSQN